MNSIGKHHQLTGISRLMAVAGVGAARPSDHPGFCAEEAAARAATALRLARGQAPIAGWRANGRPEGEPVSSITGAHTSE